MNFYYNTFLDNVVYNKGPLISIFEFPVLTIVGATFKNVNNNYPCSLIEGFNNGFYTIYSTSFSGFTSFTEGSILYVEALKIGRTLISGLSIVNCSTAVSFFTFTSSKPNNINYLTMVNVKGRIFRVTQKSTLILNYMSINNNSCLNLNLFQQACVFYVDTLSSIDIYQANFSNVRNADTPGAFYIENSNSTISFLNFTNITSETGYGCAYAVGANFKIYNSTLKNFKNGCLQLEKSYLLLENNSFINNGMSNYEKIYGSIISCVYCLQMSIIGCRFEGNQMNSLDGGVFF